ncbi:CHAT domain-containing protein [Kribbella sp. VKM Ac-2568]|uniref:CHAT domain-containing protein n=1 Tax=Kribbella sp. VKM Ac-2568 TaxID=2512219 RepID=UPI0010458DF7|nr:CHAT domain-containing protein [Kribbella sp. VKM Ac-2568]TCM33825.1 CHAT domain-containing protein [Kribbella sp. VKM Ac-2568]
MSLRGPPGKSTPDPGAVAAAEASLRDAPRGEDPGDRAVRLVELADLRRLVGDGTDPTEQGRTITLYQQARDLVDPDSEMSARILVGLAGSLRERYLAVGDPADLDVAVVLAEQAVRSRPPDSGQRLRGLLELGVLLYGRYQRARMPLDLDRAIELLGQTFDIPGQADRTACRWHLGVAFAERRAPDDLDRASDILGSLADDLPPGSADRHILLNELFWIEQQRAGPDDRLDAMERVIARGRHTLAESPDGWPERMQVIEAVGDALIRRGVRYRQPAGFTEAINLLRHGIESVPVATPGRAALEYMMARAQVELFHVLPQREILDRAIDAARDAVAESYTDDPDRLRFARLLAQLSIEHRRIVEGPMAVLTDRTVIDPYAAAVDALPFGHPDRPHYLVELVDLLWGGGGPGRDPRVLDEVVPLMTEAVAQTTRDAPHRGSFLYRLGTVLEQRSALLLDADDLDRAIECYRTVLDLYPPGSVERVDYLLAIASALSRRAGRTRDFRELNAMRAELEGLLPTLTADDPAGHNLRYLLATIYDEEHGDPDGGDLQRKITLLKELVATPLAGAPPDDAATSMLAVSLMERGRHVGDLGDTSTAISMLREILARTPIGHHDRIGTRANLAHALEDRFRQAQDRADLDEAVSLLESAVLDAGADAPDRPQADDILARALHTRYRAFGSMADLDRAVDNWEHAWRQLQDTFWALPVPYKRGQQSVWSSTYRRLVAALLTRAEARPEAAAECRRRALVVAESAKSRLLSDLVGRDWLPAPAAVEPLLERERELLRLLSVWDMPRVAEVPDAPSVRDRPDRLRELNQVWSRMEAAGPEAADYVGLRRGDSPDWDDLAEVAAEAGPDTAVVSLSFTEDSTVLFVLRAGWDAPEVVQADLPASVWVDAQGRLVREIARSYGRPGPAVTWHRRVDGLLQQAAPHLDGAGLILASPSGSAYQMPWALLADVGGWRGPAGSTPAIAMVPSLGLRLRQIRRSPAIDTDGVRLALVAGDPQGQLPHARDEATAVAALYDTVPLLGPQATRNRVLAELNRCAIAHLATHAQFDPESSLDSGIELADGPLTARDVLNLRTGLDLLVLSACDTGRVEISPGDELAGLVQAFLLAGARHVAVSLWPVDDAATARLMTRFHERLRHDGTTPAAALHAAADDLRAHVEHTHPYYWAAFVTVGG